MADKNNISDYQLLELPRDQLLIIINSQRNLIKEAVERIDDIQQTKTEEVREGIFIKRIVRQGNKKHEKLTRIKKNEKKVVLFYLGNIEFFCYPYQSSETVYARIGKEITGLNKYELKGMLAIHNRLNWVVNGGIKNAIRGKSNSSIAKKIESAWMVGHQEELTKINEYKNKISKEQKNAKKSRKKFEKSMPQCNECNVPAKWYFGTKNGEPLRLCIKCGRVYNELTKEFVGMRLEVDVDGESVG